MGEASKRINTGAAGWLLDHGHNLLRQNYRGDITMIPRFRMRSFARVVSNPTPAEIADYILAAERQTWPRIEQIRNATMVSKTIDQCLTQLKEQNKKSSSGIASKVTPMRSRRQANA